MKRRLLVAAATTAALAMAPAHGQEGDFPLVVNVQETGDACRMTVDGAEVPVDRLLRLAGDGRSRRAIIVSRQDASYRCIGGAIYTLQRAGLHQIDIAIWTGP